MKKTKFFNIDVPELGDRPDITQVSNAIGSLEDALAGTMELMDGNIQGNKLTLTSLSRNTKRTKYYNGLTIQFVAKAQINSNTVTRVTVDNLGEQTVSIPFLVRKNDCVCLTYKGSKFEAVTLVVQKDNSITSTSEDTVATSYAVKQVNDKITKTNNDKLDKGGYTGTANDLKKAIDTKANKTVLIQAGNGLTGGGDLTTNRALNVASANSGIRVNADNIELMTLDSISSTDKVRPASANSVKLTNDKINDLDTKSLKTRGVLPIFNGTNGDFVAKIKQGVYDIPAGDVFNSLKLPSGVYGFGNLTVKYNGRYGVNLEYQSDNSEHFYILNEYNFTNYPDRRDIAESAWSKVYMNKNKPTPSELNVYSKSESDERYININGDRMQGTLEMGTQNILFSSRGGAGNIPHDGSTTNRIRSGFDTATIGKTGNVDIASWYGVSITSLYNNPNGESQFMFDTRNANFFAKNDIYGRFLKATGGVLSCEGTNYPSIQLKNINPSVPKDRQRFYMEITNSGAFNFVRNALDGTGTRILNWDGNQGTIYHTGKKPTYNDVGAIRNGLKDLRGNINWNGITESGAYNIIESTNMPFNNYPWGILLVFGNDSSYCTQIYIPHSPDASHSRGVMYRVKYSSDASWTQWSVITNSKGVVSDIRLSSNTRVTTWDKAINIYASGRVLTGAFKDIYDGFMDGYYYANLQKLVNGTWYTVATS